MLIEEMLTRLFGDNNLKAEFVTYSKSFVGIKGREEISKTRSITINFYISIKQIEVLNDRMMELGFSERSPFMRCLVAFFHDKFMSKDYTEFLAALENLLNEKGLGVAQKGIIDGNPYLVIPFQDVLIKNRHINKREDK